MAGESQARVIGRLESKIDTLADAVRANNEDAQESRRRLYEKIEDISKAQAVQSMQAADIEARLKTVEASAQTTEGKVKSWETRFMTITGLVSAAGAGVGALAIYFKEWLIGKIVG